MIDANDVERVVKLLDAARLRTADLEATLRVLAELTGQPAPQPDHVIAEAEPVYQQGMITIRRVIPAPVEPPPGVERIEAKPGRKLSVKDQVFNWLVDHAEGQTLSEIRVGLKLGSSSTLSTSIHALKYAGRVTLERGIYRLVEAKPKKPKGQTYSRKGVAVRAPDGVRAANERKAVIEAVARQPMSMARLAHEVLGDHLAKIDRDRLYWAVKTLKRKGVIVLGDDKQYRPGTA